MIETIGKSEAITSFVNEIWVTLHGRAEADRVFLHKPSLQDVESDLVTIKSKDGLPEQNLYKLIQEGISFDEFNRSDRFNLMEKSRLLRIKTELTEFIIANNT